jgi:hypothetical protein
MNKLDRSLRNKAPLRGLPYASLSCSLSLSDASCTSAIDPNTQKSRNPGATTIFSLPFVSRSCERPPRVPDLSGILRIATSSGLWLDRSCTRRRDAAETSDESHKERDDKRTERIPPCGRKPQARMRLILNVGIIRGSGSLVAVFKTEAAAVGSQTSEGKCRPNEGAVSVDVILCCLARFKIPLSGSEGQRDCGWMLVGLTLSLGRESHNRLAGWQERVAVLLRLLPL